MAAKIVDVKTLRDLAFPPVYQELMSELNVIFRKEKKRRSDIDDNQGPPAKLCKLSNDYVLSQVAIDKALNDLREKLDENLIGPYSEERRRIVDRFIMGHSTLKPFEVEYNLCLAFSTLYWTRASQSSSSLEEKKITHSNTLIRQSCFQSSHNDAPTSNHLIYILEKMHWSLEWFHMYALLWSLLKA